MLLWHVSNCSFEALLSAGIKSHKWEQSSVVLFLIKKIESASKEYEYGKLDLDLAMFWYSDMIQQQIPQHLFAHLQLSAPKLFYGQVPSIGYKPYKPLVSTLYSMFTYCFYGEIRQAIWYSIHGTQTFPVCFPFIFWSRLPRIVSYFWYRFTSSGLLYTFLFSSK